VATTRILTLQGTIDSSNRVFRTGVAYTPRSTAFILDGLVRPLTGYTESDPSVGEITTDVAPVPGDTLQLFFLDVVTPPAPTPARLTGTISTQRLRGVVRAPVVPRLVGVVRGK